MGTIEESKQEKIENINYAFAFFKKNPLTTKAAILGLIACLIPIFMPVWGIISIIFVIIATRFLLKAKKNNENRKFIYISYIIAYLPIVILTVIYN